jgi:proteasome beta subunit
MGQESFMPGATTLGLVCKDGVILASERRVSYGYFVMSKTGKKVFKITDSIGAACAGLVADMQILVREVAAHIHIYTYETNRDAAVKTTAKLMGNLLFQRRMFPYLTQTIIAGIDNEGPSLYVLDPLGSVLGDKYASVGTGSEMAVGVLESDYKDGMTIEEAKKVIADAFKSAIARDVGSGEGADLLIITKDGIKEESLKFA